MAKQINVCGGGTIFIPPCDPGGDCELTTKSITQNGSYDASDDYADGYSRVTVNVPNTYQQSDNGKVVDDGSLVQQTPVTITDNGVYDTTKNNEVTVDVQSEAILIDGVATENGLYLASNYGASGFKQMSVNVSCSGEHGLHESQSTYFNSSDLFAEFSWNNTATGWLIS